MDKSLKTIVLIGAGNVATQLGMSLPLCGFSVVQVYSRTLQAAQTLAFKIGADFTDDLSALYPTADLYIYAVKDDALPATIADVKTTHGLHVHTAGSVSMAIFEERQFNFGVLYPFQTFSKEKKIDFKTIPIFIEGNTPDNLLLLEQLARKLSDFVQPLNSKARETLHLSGVFACNFTNHLYSIAQDLLQDIDVPFSALLPLIQESVSKLNYLSPKQAQTGPAVRGDLQVMNHHIDMLQRHPEWQKLYKQLSELIDIKHS